MSKQLNGWYCVQQYPKRRFRTKQEAENALMEMEISMMKGTLIKASRMSFKAFLVEMYLKYNMTQVKRRNLESYTMLIDEYVTPYFGHLDISELTSKRIQQFYNRLMKTNKISNRNIQKIHTMINDSLRTAVRWSFITNNPAAHVDRPLICTKQDTILNSSQVKTVFRAANGLYRYCIFYNIALTSSI